MALLLLPLLPILPLLALGLLGYGIATLGRLRWHRTLAVLLGACAVGLYAWGLLHVAGAVLAAEDGGAGSSPILPCRTPGQDERASHVVDYTVDYVPLRFVCEMTGGGSYAAESVPGYVNPAVLGFALAAAVCAGAGAAEARRRARTDPPG
ncbi:MULTISPECIES: hypothetical protein [Streptomyces]|uniref:Integral membrane protein n=1 Tax=Streptomyces spororaveus TaxID=284039 RepID=A0ABQ3TBI4_9ACTN|nr:MULTISPECIES: hypothetical protein [Streptomyces]MCM9081823.1 hypothetical protein [Streptomyces spororaveus]MCX5303747.1 hypothetical protein [Streptomyces sp. NBC_00160]GHI77759.1 hypothetical protein Sspor_33200 [Streptomyces spororaveus]